MADLKQALIKAQDVQEGNGQEQRAQLYFREGADSVARELLAAVVEEYVGVDPVLGEAVVVFGVVHERPWHAYVLIAKDFVRQRFAKILKRKHHTLDTREVSTVKPYP